MLSRFVTLLKVKTFASSLVPQLKIIALASSLLKQTLEIDFNFFFWLCWVFVVARGLSLVMASGGYSRLRCAGFSLRWLLLLQSTGSRRVGFSSCGAWAQ